MKRMFLGILAAIMLAGCTQQENESNEPMHAVTFQCNGFSVSHEGMTRATLTEGGAAYLYCFVDGELVLTQTSTDASFGTPTLSMSHGDHTATFVASQEAMTFASGTATPSAKVKDTFWGATSISVNANTTKAVTLHRNISRLTVTINDAFPSTVDKVRVVLTNHGMTFSIADGWSTTQATYTNEWTTTASHGMEGVTFTTNTYCPSSAEWNATATIQFIDSEDHVLQTRTADLTLKANRATKMSGDYAHDAATTITVSNEWDEESEVGF